MKKLSQIAMTGGRIIAKTAIVYGLIITPYAVSDTYAGWRGTGSSGTESYHDKKQRKQPSKRFRKFQRHVQENPLTVIKPMINIGDPTGVTNKLLDAWDKGKFKGRMPQMLRKGRRKQ
ncbi:hypothetical protein GOV13_00845 [Candidatus Pacearchaeota archaeon]|nr:hypothetical protein [Candidatus Pacearchaeota archaeon]